MRRLGAVTIRIRALVVEFLDGRIENLLGILDVLADFGQVGQFQRRAVFADDVHEWHFIEQQLVVIHAQFLREFKSLLHQVNVTFHRWHFQLGLGGAFLSPRGCCVHRRLSRVLVSGDWLNGLPSDYCFHKNSRHCLALQYGSFAGPAWLFSLRGSAQCLQGFSPGLPVLRFLWHSGVRLQLYDAGFRHICPTLWLVSSSTWKTFSKPSPIIFSNWSKRWLVARISCLVSEDSLMKSTISASSWSNLFAASMNISG